MITFGKKTEKPAGAGPERVAAVLPAQPVAPASAGREDEGAWRVLPLEGSFQFSYLDASGRPSLRRLCASELKVGPGKLLLGGVDADLGAYRGFRVDRIHSLQAAGSGAIVSRNILDWLLDQAARQARERTACEKAERSAAADGKRRKRGATAAASLAAA